MLFRPFEAKRYSADLVWRLGLGVIFTSLLQNPFY